MAQMALESLGRPVHPGAQARTRRTAVVGHDGSRMDAAVIAHASQRVAPDGYLIVVHALPLGVSEAAAEPGEAYAHVTRSVLRGIEAVLPEGLSYEARVVAGPASKALLDTAARWGADEIVLGASSGRAARGAIGRIADTVLRHAQCPVTIVPRKA